MVKGLKVKAKGNKKQAVEQIDVLEDDQFEVTPQVVAPTTSVKNVLDSILQTQVSNPTKTVLAHFKKPIQKTKQEKIKIKQQAKLKQQISTSTKNDGCFKFVNNQKLQKQLKLATMKGVLKIMNIISTYRRQNPEQIK